MAAKSKKPTDEQRKQIQTLAGFGLTQEQIARVLGMHRETLRKHALEDFERGKDLALTQAVQSLFANIKKGKEASIFFYLKTQHRWREIPKDDEPNRSGAERPAINFVFNDKPTKK